MTKVNIEFFGERSNEANLLNFSYTLEDQNSTQLSLFQSIGCSLQWIDAAIERTPEHALYAINYFRALAENYEWAECVPMHLLLAKDWKSRMHVAWHALATPHRTVASELNYNVFHNFWPNTDFCKPNWDAEVKLGLSNLATRNNQFEFNVTTILSQTLGSCDHVCNVEWPVAQNCHQDELH